MLPRRLSRPTMNNIWIQFTTNSRYNNSNNSIIVVIVWPTRNTVTAAVIGQFILKINPKFTTGNQLSRRGWPGKESSSLITRCARTNFAAKSREINYDSFNGVAQRYNGDDELLNSLMLSRSLAVYNVYFMCGRCCCTLVERKNVSVKSRCSHGSSVYRFENAHIKV